LQMALVALLLLLLCQNFDLIRTRLYPRSRCVSWRIQSPRIPILYT
jgi:hypothetical protein